MQRLDAQRLRKKVVAYAALAVFIACGIVAAVSIVPLQNKLRETTLESLSHILQLKIIAATETLNFARSLAQQTASRSQIRDKLAALNAGTVTREEFVAFTRDKLFDAQRSTPAIAAISRLNFLGDEVIHVGIPFPPSARLLPENDEVSGVVGNLLTIGATPYLSAAAPILDRQGRRVGTDSLLVSAKSLEALTQDYRGLGATGEAILFSVGQGRTPAPLFKTRAGGYARVQALAQALSDPAHPATGTKPQKMVRSDGIADMAVMAPLPGSSWVIAVVMEQDEVFADIDRIIAFVVAAIIALGVLVAVGVAMVLRPLTGRILVATEELQSQVTNLEIAQAQLNERTQELARSNVELERFAHVASHDLREPLRTITSYTQLIFRKLSPESNLEVREFADFIIDAANRMNNLIDGLLIYARLGQEPPPQVPVECDMVLKQVQYNLKEALRSSGAELLVGGLPTVRGDSTQLAQVFQNLLSNALKFRTEERPCRIQIAAEKIGPRWHFTVSDNGIGLPPDATELVFQPFHRLHGSSEYPGTGLGLAICRRVVENHGGRIWVTPNPDFGCTVHIELPVLQEDTEEAGGDAADSKAAQ